MRTSKEPEERRSEILDAAEALFFTKGYTRTTVNDILQAVGIAKGTLYYYYKSKEEIMDAVVVRFIDQGVAAARQLASNPQLTVHEKLLHIIMAQKPDPERKAKMIEQMHQTDNAQIHQKSLTETILRLTPVLTQVVEQGVEENVFHTEFPKESIEVILTTALFLFDEDLFSWGPEEMKHKIIAFIAIVETILGADKGSLFYLLETLGWQV